MRVGWRRVINPASALSFEGTRRPLGGPSARASHEFAATGVFEVAETKAAYLLDDDDVDPNAILEGHRDATVERIGDLASDRILVVHDTTALPHQGNSAADPRTTGRFGTLQCRRLALAVHHLFGPLRATLPASSCLSSDEIEVLNAKFIGHRAQSRLGLRTAVRWIAQLGGFLAHRRDGEPGSDRPKLRAAGTVGTTPITRDLPCTHHR